ncbi:MAG: glycosyltransferase family 2 protein [Ruminococcus sp.]
MQRELFEVKRERFHLLDPDIYILQGSWPKEYEPDVWLDNEPVVEVAMEDWENTSALERFTDLDMMRGKKVTMYIHLPSLKNRRKLKIYAACGDERILWFSISAADLLKRQGKPFYYIEEERANPSSETLKVRGWVAWKEPVAIRVYDENGKRIPCDIQQNNRVDVVEMFKETDIDPKCGFYLELSNVKTKVVYLVFRASETKAIHPMNMRRAVILAEKTLRLAKKGRRYMASHGLKALIIKGAGKIAGRRKAPVSYEKWLPKHLPTAAQLARQKETTFDYMPKISIVVPLYRTPESYLEQLIQSVKDQTYENWELCLSDGSGENSPLKRILERHLKEEKRIKAVFHEKSLKIAENTNAAIEAATGEWIAFADHDDILTPDALFSCVKEMNAHRDAEIIYSDEDKMSMDGHKFFQPHFKPDYNPDLLCTVNYICHLFLAKRSIVDQAGMLRGEYDGAQDYDFIFRCVETSRNICHVPRILYHWRSHEDSTSENPESKLYAFDAGQRAVQAHYDRMGIKAEVTKGEYLGLYRTRFIRDYDPLISIIIPNKDHTEDLERCIRSIEEKSTYKNYEYIIVENNSTQEKTFAYYKELEMRNPKVHVVYWEGIFNYSAINNFGATYAKGEYFLLLNNDTEIINPDCLEELLGYCMREDVGAVGARLYYEDDTIQHAGVVIGFGGIAGHCFVMQPRGYTGYCHRIICAQDYSAVTAACMMVKRSVFEEVGGLSEELQVAFNDIDFCMKIRKTGRLIVYNPYAELYHYESKSRGLEDTPEKVARFNREIAVFEKKWPDIFRTGDPYYNPNLTLDSQDFSLKRI